MTIQYFLCIFLLLSYLLPICYSGNKPTSGPFKSSIVSVKDCSDPCKPYLANPPIMYYPSVQNIDGKNMLGGNLTVFKETKDYKTKLKSFAWRNGKLHQIHSFYNMNCHSALLRFTFLAIGVKYDKKNCMLFEGSYVFQKLDVNQLQHIWVPSMPYGRLLWRTESISKDGMFFCKEFDTVTEPA